MEYSIYINQVKAVEWELSMGESIMFSYLISSSDWMVPLKSNPEYKWASNSKLQAELPLVCAHEGSARRHMAALESKGLIERISAGNKSYFRITEKGLEWKSNTLKKPNESVCPKSEAKRIGLPKPNESVCQSDIPISNKPNNKKTNKKDSAVADESELKRHCVDAYHRHIHWGTQVHKWTKPREVALRRLLKNHPETRNPKFWDAYFQQAALDKFIRGEIRPRQSDTEPFKVNIDYLLREQVYVQFYERSMSASGRAA